MRLGGGKRGQRRDTVACGAVEWLELRRLLNADPYYDLSQQTNSSNPSAFTEFDGQVVFTASGPQGNQPYITDGTAEGTRLLKAISGGSSPGNYYVWNDHLYFTVSVTGAKQLWISDGTSAGTNFLATLSSGSATVSGFTPFANHLYFIAAGSLWETDGTPGGTQIAWAQAAPTDGSTANPVILNNELLFIGTDSTSGSELRALNTGGSFRLVDDLLPGHGSGNPSMLVSAGSVVYFDALLSATGQELYVTDGTVAGTHLVADVRPGSASSSPNVLAAQNGVAFFSAFVSTPSVHQELFFTDGSTATDLGVKLNNNLSAGQYAVLNGALFFTFTDAAAGTELWKSDGTAGGTGRLVDLLPGTSGSNPASLQVMNNTLYFTAKGPQGASWWSSDGTAAGTHARTQDYAANTPSVLDGDLVIAGSSLQFGSEPFVEDPLDNTKALLTDLNTSPASLPVNSYLRRVTDLFQRRDSALADRRHGHRHLLASPAI